MFKKSLIVFAALISFSSLLFSQQEKKENLNEFLWRKYGDKIKLLSEKFYELAEKLEIKASESEPPWAKKKSKPIFKFVQLSDIHYSPPLENLTKNAFHFISNEIKPDFVIITGNDVYPPTLENHQAFKKLVDENLNCKTFIIKGDNDSRNYEEVFGNSIYSFDYCGVHFVALALDWDFEFIGIGFFSQYTWLLSDLCKNRSKPIIVFMHTNIYPPTFLGAPSLLAILHATPGFTATCTGHLHKDLEFEFLNKKHIVAPSLANDQEHGFKVYNVYQDDIIVHTYELDPKTNKYCFANKYQQILFPKKCKPENAEKKEVKNFNEAPKSKTIYIDEYYYELKSKIKNLKN